jgi:hypothetical protein
MATIITLVLFVAAIVLLGGYLLRAPFFSETLQQKQIHEKRMPGSKSSALYYILTPLGAKLKPFNDDKLLKEREVNQKSFEKAVDDMIGSEFSGVLGEN